MPCSFQSSVKRILVASCAPAPDADTRNPSASATRLRSEKHVMLLLLNVDGQPIANSSLRMAHPVTRTSMNEKMT